MSASSRLELQALVFGNPKRERGTESRLIVPRSRFGLPKNTTQKLAIAPVIDGLVVLETGAIALRLKVSES